LRQQLVLYGRRQYIELRLELLGKFDDPCHGANMPSKAYGVKNMDRSARTKETCLLILQLQLEGVRCTPCRTDKEIHEKPEASGL
jgi:hypothetical protein